MTSALTQTKQQQPRRRRVGIVGYGSLGQYLVEHILTDEKVKPIYELAFVWNRSIDKVQAHSVSSHQQKREEGGKEKEGEEEKSFSAVVSHNFQIPDELILSNLENFEAFHADLIVEVSHPSIYKKFGTRFLSHADLFAASPTAFAVEEVFQKISSLAKDSSVDTGLYLPCGALWGAEDIAKMGDRGNITALTVTMRKPATSMKLEEPLQSKLNAFLAKTSATDHEKDEHEEGKKQNEKQKVADVVVDETVIYSGPIRDICPLAPNNVNTMAFAALATGVHVGFDKAIGILIAEGKRDNPAHTIEIEVVGLPLPGRTDPFYVYTKRVNPCHPNVVTGSATYASFLSSLVRAGLHRGPGIFFC